MLPGWCHVHVACAGVVDTDMFTEVTSGSGSHAELFSVFNKIVVRADPSVRASYTNETRFKCK